MSSAKSENSHFDVLLLLVAWSFSEKNAGVLSLMTLKSDPNFEKKLTFCLKNDMNNLVNFNLNGGKSENVHFDGILLSKLCNTDKLGCEKWLTVSKMT